MIIDIRENKTWHSYGLNHDNFFWKLNILQYTSKWLFMLSLFIFGNMLYEIVVAGTWIYIGTLSIRKEKRLDKTNACTCQLAQCQIICVWNDLSHFWNGQQYSGARRPMPFILGLYVNPAPYTRIQRSLSSSLRISLIFTP